MLTEVDRVALGAEQERILKSPRLPRRLLRYVCRDCIYDPSAGGSSRAQIQRCTVELCPLYPLRHLWAGEAAPEGSAGLSGRVSEGAAE